MISEKCFSNNGGEAKDCLECEEDECILDKHETYLRQEHYKQNKEKLFLHGRRLQILIFLDDYQKKHGYLPSVIQIGESFRIGRAAIYHHLWKLENARYIQRIGVNQIKILKYSN